MNNKLTDLNNFLFAQMERLDEEDIDTETLEKEIKRTKAIKEIGTAIVENARLALDAQKFIVDYGRPGQTLPEMLDVKK